MGIFIQTFSLVLLFLEQILSLLLSPLLCFLPRSRSGLLARLGLVRINQGLAKQRILVVAASMGDVRSIYPLCQELSKDYSIVLAVQSPSGMKEGLRFKGETFEEVFFLPFDGLIQHFIFLKSLGIKKVILEFKELWPSLLSLCFWLNIPVIWFHAFLKEEKVSVYKNFNFFFPFCRRSIKSIFIRDLDQRQRIKAAGFPMEAQRSFGWLKFFSFLNQENQKYNEVKDYDLVFGSFLHTELTQIMSLAESFREYKQDCNIAFVPRHLYGEEKVPKEFSKKGFHLINKFGILKEVYQRSTTAVVCGSFDSSRGGQNPLEPIFSGCKTYVGPYNANFDPLVKNLIQKNILEEIRNYKVWKWESTIAPTEDSIKALREELVQISNVDKLFASIKKELKK